jgi:Spy/CpxP family protein refolding chaperone
MTSAGTTSLPAVPRPAPRAPASPPAPVPAIPAPKQTAIETRITRLDTLVRLTPEQQLQVAAIFQKEADALAAFSPGEDRMLQGMDARQGARAEVRALLTPEQRRKYDVTPQGLGGGMRTNPESLMQRLDQVVTLSADQKKQATAIFWDDIIDQMAALPPEQELPGFRWGDKVREQLRVVLTPEQQAKFDATTPYKMNKRATGSR